MEYKKDLDLERIKLLGVFFSLYDTGVRKLQCFPDFQYTMIVKEVEDLASQFPEVAAEWSERNAPLLPK